MGAASAAMADQTPSDSKICREPLPSAVVRSSKLGCVAESAGTLSMSRTRSFVVRSASAKLAPTMPPPTIATSQFFMTTGSCDGCHEALDRDRILRDAGGEHLPAVARDHHVVFDADSDAVIFLRHTARARRDVDAGLDGQRHPGLEHA